MNNIVDIAKQIFENQPFSKDIGAKLDILDNDNIQITIKLNNRHKQQHGFAHGGVISYLADNCLTFAGGIALGGDALTAEYKINYIRPSVGVMLLAKSHPLSVGKRQSVCCAEIFDVDEKGERSLCAYAVGTIVKTGE